MSIEVVAEIWNELKYDFDEVTQREAAGKIIDVLVDYNFDSSEIKQAFRGDTVMMAALKDYNAEHETNDEEYDEEYDEDDYYEDEEDEDDY